MERSRYKTVAEGKTHFASGAIINWMPIFWVMCFWISGAFGQTDGRSPTISDISLDKKLFFPEKKELVKIGHTVSRDSVVTVRLYDDTDVLVRTLVREKKIAAGPHSKEWDGKNDAGDTLPSGVYVYTVEAADGGERTVYDPADETGGILLKVKKSFLDREKGEISYVMPKAGMVRIRAGIKDGPMLRTLFDWEPREAGRNVEKWDGRDKSGLIDLFATPETEVWVFAYSLPDNSVILSSHVKPATTAKSTPSASFPGSVVQHRPKKKTEPKYEHATHEKHACHEPEFRVMFPPDAEKTPEGIPIVGGIVPVKTVISETDRRHLESERFEVMFFVDTVFIFEDEEGFTPFTYMWNTRDLSEGEHVFTVNIMSYDDHCGVETSKVIIRR